MKTLLLVRHAKTESIISWKKDLDRALTASGEQDAKKMGEWLNLKKLQVDQVLSSPAVRTRQTTQLLCKAMHIDDSVVTFPSDLYHATPDIFFNLIRTLPDAVKTLLIVSHNDGITHFANMLTDARIDYMQPGSVFVAKSDCETWESFKESEREFVLYKQPGK